MTGFYALMLLKKLYDGEDSLSKTLAARLDAPLNRLCRKVSAAVMKQFLQLPAHSVLLDEGAEAGCPQHV